MSAVASVFTVLKTYVTDGRIVCDLARMGVGPPALTAVPVLVMGGGPGRTLFVPPSAAVQQSGSPNGSVLDPGVNQGAQVVVLYVATDPYTAPQPMIVGCLAHTGSGLTEAQSEAAESDDDADTAIDARAVAITNAGATVLADQRGEVTIAPVAGGSARVQLSAGGVLRVSRDGDASEAATLSQALCDALEPLYSEFRAAQTQIAALTALATHVTTTVPAYVPVPVDALTNEQVASAVLRVSAER